MSSQVPDTVDTVLFMVGNECIRTPSEGKNAEIKFRTNGSEWMVLLPGGEDRFHLDDIPDGETGYDTLVATRNDSGLVEYGKLARERIELHRKENVYYFAYTAESNELVDAEGDPLPKGLDEWGV